MSDMDIQAGQRVYLVDDDPAVLKALSRQLRTRGWVVDTFDSAEAFLSHRDPLAVACLVLDVTLPGLDGIELQQKLIEMRETIPIVFLTGHGDVPMSVRAMKAGASNFLIKPVSAADLCDAIGLAMDEQAIARLNQIDTVGLRQRLDSLTPREREVFEAIAAGRLNKQIAGDLGIVEQTVKFHRARIMQRMHARTTAELMRLAAKLGIGEHS
jgi:FixJ family two-component response regulator